MKIAIRVDGNRQIGIGHLARCVSLAEALQSRGATIVFVVRDLGFDAAQFVEERGFAALELPAPEARFEPGENAPPHAAWAQIEGASDAEQTAELLAAGGFTHLVIDHYGFDATWHERTRARLGIPIVAIDDLADRQLAVDLLVDHNCHSDHREKYSQVLSAGTEILGGPEYALLSPNYAEAPRWSEAHSEGIGIFLGGGDPLGLTPEVVQGLRDRGYAGLVEVVTTSASQSIGKLQKLAAQDSSLVLSRDLASLSPFFASRKVQIGAGGGATWERCCVGAPSIVISTADNQDIVLEALKMTGVALTANYDSVVEMALHLLEDNEARARLSRNARNLVDGRGTGRVAEAILKL